MSFDWDASTYDRVSNPHVRWAAPVIERLDPAGVEVVLDAGCGSGRVTEMLLHRFPDIRVIGADASPSMIAEATQRLDAFGDRVSFVEADLQTAFPDLPQVDAVFTTAAFHWITDHATLFGNLAGVTKPGGQFVGQWGGGDNIAAVVEVLRTVGDGWAGPWYFATTQDTERDLAAAGFTDAEVFLHDDPADFDTDDAFEEFLATVVLGAHLERLPADEHAAFVTAVAERLPSRRVDYVRLNVVARKTLT